MERQVKLWALSTCAWCKKTKKFLEERAIACDVIDVDLLAGDEKTQVKVEVARFNPRLSYPTMLIDGEIVIVGFDEDRLKEVFGHDDQQGQG